MSYEIGSIDPQGVAIGDQVKWVTSLSSKEGWKICPQVTLSCGSEERQIKADGKWAQVPEIICFAKAGILVKETDEVSIYAQCHGEWSPSSDGQHLLTVTVKFPAATRRVGTRQVESTASYGDSTWLTGSRHDEAVVSNISEEVICERTFTFSQQIAEPPAEAQGWFGKKTMSRAALVDGRLYARPHGEYAPWIGIGTPDQLRMTKADGAKFEWSKKR